MSAIHVLELNPEKRRATLVLHQTMPVGNNQAGTSWKNCIIFTGRNKSILTVGTGPGQIASAENTDVVAGNVLELVVQAEVDGDPTIALLNNLASFHAASEVTRLQATLRYYGFTNG
jgi:hypothetical protein